MAKTAIHTHQQALSAYFEDMLTVSAAPVHSTSAQLVETATAVITPDETTQTESQTDNGHFQSTPIAASAKYILVQVNGLPIAVEMHTVNNLVHWPENGLVTVPGDNNDILGLYPDRDTQTVVLNLSCLLNLPIESTQPYRYLMLFHHRRYAIACQQIDQIQTLSADQFDTHSSDNQTGIKGVKKLTQHRLIDLVTLLQTPFSET